jgi:hypothetical protein
VAGSQKQVERARAAGEPTMLAEIERELAGIAKHVPSDPQLLVAVIQLEQGV